MDKILMPVTHSQESCTQNVCKLHQILMQVSYTINLQIIKSNGKQCKQQNNKSSNKPTNHISQF